MSRGLEIVAMGGRSPVGLRATASAAAVRAGINRFRELPFVTLEGEPMIAATDGRLDARLEGAERLVSLGQSVLDELVRALGSSTPFRGPLTVRIALPEPRPGLPEPDLSTTTSALTSHLRAQGMQPRIEPPTLGHAGVSTAIERALREAEQGVEALTLVLGVDSYYHPETWAWLEQDRRFGPESRGGIVPGEGAGGLLLASPRLRQQLGLPCLARIGGVGLAHEPLGPDSETGSFGEGMTRAIRGALAGSTLPGDAVSTVYADITGERHRSEEWGFVAMRIPSAFTTLAYEAPADCWGDVGAASGALCATLAVQSWARGYARGPRALVLTASPSGPRGAILLLEPSGS